MRTTFYMNLDVVVMVEKTNVPWAKSVRAHKVVVANRALVLAVSCEHTLETHAHTFNVLNRTPALCS